MDSGPSPMGILDNVLQTSFFNNQSFLCLPFHMFGVNAANRMNIKENLRLVKHQISQFPRTYPRNRNVPWTGRFVSYHEKGDWPILFLYSKEDKLLSWKYLELVIKTKKSTDRRVESHLFDGSGHVAHFKRHPALYTQLVKTFIQSV